MILNSIAHSVGMSRSGVLLVRTARSAESAASRPRPRRNVPKLLLKFAGKTLSATPQADSFSRIVISPIIRRFFPFCYILTLLRERAVDPMALPQPTSHPSPAIREKDISLNANSRCARSSLPRFVETRNRLSKTYRFHWCGPS